MKPVLETSKTSGHILVPIFHQKRKVIKVLKIQEFYNEIDIKNLKIYHDSSTKSGLFSKAKGLPLTILMDHKGREVGRRDGPWEWDDKAVIEIIESYKQLSIN